ncbi:unnamed protein product, partial [Mycena citricolor]
MTTHLHSRSECQTASPVELTDSQTTNSRAIRVLPHRSGCNQHTPTSTQMNEPLVGMSITSPYLCSNPRSILRRLGQNERRSITLVECQMTQCFHRSALEN